MKVSSLLWTVCASLLINSMSSVVFANEYIGPDSIPGESIANSDVKFLKRFHHLLVDYSKRVHQCTRPLVMDTKIVQYSKFDNSVEPPILTGPIHEQWKVTACGKKFFFYLGIAPSEENEQDVVIATVSKEVEW